MIQTAARMDDNSKEVIDVIGGRSIVCCVAEFQFHGEDDAIHQFSHPLIETHEVTYEYLG